MKFRFLLPLLLITGPLFAQAEHPFSDIPELLTQLGATDGTQMFMADPQVPNTIKWDFNQEGNTLTMLGQCVSKDGTPLIIVQTIDIQNVKFSAKNLSASLRAEMMAANGGQETCNLVFKCTKGKKAISSKQQFGATTGKMLFLNDTEYTCKGAANSPTMVKLLVRMHEFQVWIKSTKSNQ